MGNYRVADKSSTIASPLLRYLFVRSSPILMHSFVTYTYVTAVRVKAEMIGIQAEGKNWQEYRRAKNLVKLTASGTSLHMTLECKCTVLDVSQWKMHDDELLDLWFFFQ